MLLKLISHISFSFFNVATETLKIINVAHTVSIEQNPSNVTTALLHDHFPDPAKYHQLSLRQGSRV